MTSCANVGSKSDDTDECRKIAYGKGNELIVDSVDPTFLQCQQKKESLREDKNRAENTKSWISFFMDLFLPSDD